MSPDLSVLHGSFPRSHVSMLVASLMSGLAGFCLWLKKSASQNSNIIRFNLDIHSCVTGLNSFPRCRCNDQLFRKRPMFVTEKEQPVITSERSDDEISLHRVVEVTVETPPCLKQYSNCVTASGCVYCGFMEL